MSDPRIHKLASVLVNYSLELQAGENFLLSTHPLAEELSLAIYKEAILAGAHCAVLTSLPGAREIFFKYANDAQLAHIAPVQRIVYDEYDAILTLDAIHNSRELSGVDPERQRINRTAMAEISKIFMNRLANGSLKWCGTVYPTHAAAQDADMSLSDYQDFVYGAGLLDQDDPVVGWKAEAEKQRKIIDWLKGKDKVAIQGKDVDLRMSIKGRGFKQAAGRMNFPDGEIYTSPVEDSVEGWIRFKYPGIFSGKEVENIELWFEKGKVFKEKASKGYDLLTALLDTDEGARYLGELGIGTNYGIQKFTKNMLFDEKMGGTIHLAVGAGFPEIGGQNQSGLHWDMLCDMSEGEIIVDDLLFYKDGKIRL